MEEGSRLTRRVKCRKIWSTPAYRKHLLIIIIRSESLIVLTLPAQFSPVKVVSVFNFNFNKNINFTHSLISWHFSSISLVHFLLWVSSYLPHSSRQIHILCKAKNVCWWNSKIEWQTRLEFLNKEQIKRVNIYIVGVGDSAMIMKKKWYF